MVATGVALLALLLAGCGSSASSSSSRQAPGAPSGTITVLAAASLSQVFTALGRQFEKAHPGTTVRLSFGASSALAQQIIDGAPADVFASASPTNMAQVVRAGDATDPKTFASNSAEIAVFPGSASRVTRLEDLAKPGVKVALCQPQVPCGAVAQTVLSKAHLIVHPVTLGTDVTTTLNYVLSGEADAALVYVTDVKSAGARVVGVPVSAAYQASTAYPITAIKASKNLSLAQAFVAFIRSADAQRQLREAGFGPS